MVLHAIKTHFAQGDILSGAERPERIGKIFDRLVAASSFFVAIVRTGAGADRAHVKLAALFENGGDDLAVALRGVELLGKGRDKHRIDQYEHADNDT